MSRVFEDLLKSMNGNAKTTQEPKKNAEPSAFLLQDDYLDAPIMITMKYTLVEPHISTAYPYVT